MGAQPEHHAWNPCPDGHVDQKGHDLGPKGLGPKAFGRCLREAWQLPCFRAPNNVVRYTTEEMLEIAASMLPTRGWSALYVSQVIGKRSLTTAERHHPTSPSKASRRTPRVAKRGESGTLSGLEPQPATTTTTRKRMTLTRSTSGPPSVVSSTRRGHRHIT
jgi:hypothetical protein